MACETVLSAIVRSRDSREKLLQLAHSLGISQDSRIPDALREDEERLGKYIMVILGSKSEQKAVLELDGQSAECFLDVAHNILNRGFLPDGESSNKARRLIVKLSEVSHRLPSVLFITGVSGRHAYASFHGGFGDIYQASHSGETVALKHMRTLADPGEEQRRVRLLFCREALVWQRLRHPCVLPFIGIDCETFPPSLCMVSPWMENGTALKFLNDNGRTGVNKLLSQIAQGLEYLHSQTVVHGDLRGANILISNERTACLADFGLSSLSDATASHTTHRAGSARWMAPELIDPEQFEKQFLRTPASDIYALGCVCLELYTGKPPFSALPEPATMFKVLAGKRPDRPSSEPRLSDSLWECVQECWAQDSALRPTAEVVVQRMERL
ncbi:kinase-like domain-containing protein, partial [Mycena galopus ATCC 62051]